jgi:hypothetical protein
MSISSSPRTTRPEGFHQNQAGYESSDMGEEGHIGFDPRAHAEQLDKKPETQNNHRGKTNQADKKEDEHQGQHPGVREKKQVSPQDPGHGPACADHGNRGIGDGKNLRHGGRQSTEQIKNEEAKGPERIFDVVPEDPEVKHVAKEVQDPAMEKHGRKYRETDRDPGRKIIEPFSVDDLIGDRPPLEDESLVLPRIHRKLMKKNQHIRQDDANGHHGKRGSRIIVFQRKKQDRFPSVLRFSFECKARVKGLSRVFARPVSE